MGFQVGAKLLSAIDYDIGEMRLQFQAEQSITPYLGNLGTPSFFDRQDVYPIAREEASRQIPNFSL